MFEKQPVKENFVGVLELAEVGSIGRTDVDDKKIRIWVKKSREITK